MNKKNTKNVAPQLSDDSDDEPVAAKPTKDTKAVQKKAPTKKNDSDDESSDPKPKKSAPVKAPVKKAKDSDDSESESPKKPAKKVEKVTKKPVDSDSEDEKPKKKAPPKKKDSDSDDDSDAKPQPKKAPAKKKADSDSEEEKPKANKKADSDDDEEDEAPVKSTNTIAKAADDDGETHTELFVKNLSYKSTEDSIWEYFSQFGKVSNVKLLTDKNTGKPKGIGFVKFENRADAKNAMENVGEVDGRTPSCSWSNDKSGATGGNSAGFGNRGGFNKPSQSNYSGETHTIFVGNLGFKTSENTIRNFFSKVGNVVGIRIAKQEDGKAKGFGHVDFDSAEAVQKAIALAGQQLDGREIRVDASEPRKSGGAPRGGRGGFGGRGGRGGPPKQHHGAMGAGKKVTFDDDD